MYHTDLSVLKSKLKEARENNGYMLKDVQEGTGVHFTKVSNYERGRQYPSLPNLVKLADFYNVSLDELLER